MTTGSTTAWTPAENWGWTDATNALYGYVTSNNVFGTCTGGSRGGGTSLSETAFVYHDSHGVKHPLPYSIIGNTCTGGPPNVYGTNPYPLPDNSGLSVYINGIANSQVINAAGEVTTIPNYGDWNGNTGKPASQTVTSTDANGNQISASASGIFTDTMGMTVLSQTGSGTPTSPEVFTYKDSNNATQTVTVNYGTYNIATAFGVTGITEYSQTGAYLVSSIVYSADSSSYSFTYEATPGHSAYVTGRLASVTLRTGGTISYFYTGGSEGIEADGTDSGLTRTTSDGSYKYARSSITSSSSQTQRTDAYTNVDASTYLITSGYFYETDHKFYQGGATGTPLTETTTCFNTTGTPPCTSGSLAGGIGSVNYYFYANGVQFDTASQTYTAAGSGLLASASGDFGTISYTYQSFTAPNGLAFSEVSQINAVSNEGVSPARKITFGYDETTPAPTSGLPNHVAVTTPRANLTSVHDWTSGTSHLDETITYDDAGQLLTQSDWNNHLTQLQYDTATDTLLIKTTYPITSLFNTTAFDSNTGQLMHAYDLNANETSYSYDGFGRPLSVTYPDGGSKTYTYPNPNSATVTVARANTPNNVLSMTWDGYGRQASVTQSDAESGNETVTYTYDADGRAYSVTNPERSIPSLSDGMTTYGYDGASRLTKVTEPGTAQVTYSYQGTVISGRSENLLTVTDEQGKQKQYSVNEPGQILLANEPDASGAFSLVTAYVYDVAGNITSIQQAGGAANSTLYRMRNFTYDAVGRLITSNTPEQGVTTYTYVNASGGLCSGSLVSPCTRKDAIGTVTSYSYDQLNRSTGATYSDSTHAVGVMYDQSTANGITILNGKGHRTSMTDASGTNTWSYDAMGRVWTDKKTINSITKTISYTYNPDGTMATMTDYFGHTVNYEYGSTSSLLSVTDAATGTEFLSSAVYTPPGMLESVTLGNGVSMANTFNNRLQPVTLGATKSGPAVFGLSYGYGAANQDNGTIASISNTVSGQSNRSVVYTYDQLNRISGALAGTLWGYTYGIDNFGNLYSMTPTPGVTNSETSLSDPAPGVNNQLAGNTYDADGRVTTDSGGTHYTYDAEGRTLTAGPDTYTYNGDGVRVEKVGSTSRLYWPDDSGNTTNETDLTGGTSVRNVFVGELQVARQDSNGNWTYFFHDHLGSVRMVLSSTGTVINDVDYYPYGGAAFSSGSTTNLYGFTGYECDGETETNYAVFRNESPALGRFLRPDPYDGSYDVTDPQSLNRYSYVDNRPIVFSDPLGLDDGGVQCMQSSGTPTPCVYTPPGGGSGGDDCDNCDDDNSGSLAGGLGGSDGMINYWSPSGGIVNALYLAGYAANMTTQAGVGSPDPASKNKAPLGPFMAKYTENQIRGIRAGEQPWLAPGESNHFVGTTYWCVSATKFFAPGLSNFNTSHWVKGPPVMIDGRINPYMRVGMAIATLGTGSFPQAGDAIEGNSGIYAGPDDLHPNQFIILDQYPRDSKGNPHYPQTRSLFNTTGTVNNPNAYYVILVVP